MNRGEAGTAPPGYRVFRWVLVGAFAVALLLSAYGLLDGFITAFTSP
ncbi:hypothetical protein ABT337_29475 [Saccharopolyspora hirsuta]|nr:hypothetical protein [Saccharopolyspora hirsuta]